MSSLDTGRSPANNLSDILRQIASDRLLVAFLGSVLTGLNRFQNRLIAAAKADFGIYPGAAKRASDRAGNFLIRFAQPDQFRFQFTGETSSLQAFLVEESLQVRPFRVSSGVLVTLLPVLTRLNKIFDYADSIIFVHK